MTIVKHLILIYFLYIYINVTSNEIFPFLIHADQVFLKCSNGKLESFTNTTNILSTCVHTTQIERFNFFQLYIQCPDGRLHLEYNRTFSFNAQTSEYSLTSLQPHCFIDHENEYLNQNHLIPYQTRYTSENGTFTQIISFQCQHNLTKIISESSKLNGQFYLFFKLMNYGLCRYLIQFTYSNGKCNKFFQQTYKIQAQVKNSICYYQLGIHPPEISLEYFDQLEYTNLSLSTPSIYLTKSANHTIIIITALITGVSVFLCLAIFIAMYQCGLFRTQTNLNNSSVSF